jgi:ABC-type glycerol-3-phosphate transport system permease component
MPLARPATAAVAIFTFVVTWNKQIVQGISSTGLKG